MHQTYNPHHLTLYIYQYFIYKTVLLKSFIKMISDINFKKLIFKNCNFKLNKDNRLENLKSYHIYVWELIL